MCCQYFAAKENKCMFSIRTENYYSFIHLRVNVSSKYVMDYHPQPQKVTVSVTVRVRNLKLGRNYYTWIPTSKQRHFSRPKDFSGSVWGLLYRPCIHNLQNNSWHWRRTGDKGREESKPVKRWRGGRMAGEALKKIPSVNALDETTCRKQWFIQEA